MKHRMRQSSSIRRGTRASRHAQQGLTLIGLLALLALCGVIGFAALRLIPVYLNYMKVARTLDVTATEFSSDSADPDGIRRSLDKHWLVEDISAVEAKEVEILKHDGRVSLHVAYDDSVPYIANVSLSVHFDKTVMVQ